MINRIVRLFGGINKTGARTIRQARQPSRPVQVVKGKKEGIYYVSEERPLREMIYPSPSELVQLSISAVNEYKRYGLETTLGKDGGKGAGD